MVQQKKPPAFSAAGAQGSTAPSGYATGISREEASAVSQGVDTLAHDLLLAYLPDWSVPDCGFELGAVKAAKANPQGYQAVHVLGLFYLEHGDFSRSVPYLESAQRLRPVASEDRNALALALLGQNKFPEAVALLQSASGTPVKDPALLRLLALAYEFSGDHAQARLAYHASIAASPDDRENILFGGLGLISAGAPGEAAELFRSAAARHQNDARLWLGLGIAQDTMRQKKDAITSLLHAVTIDQNLVPAYSSLAALADVAPESAATIRSRLAEFVVAHPSNAEAHYNYALALWLQRRTDPESAADAEIESQLNLALGAAPAMGRAHYLLGLLYTETGDLRKAQVEFSRTVALEPGNAEAHYHLAQNYKRTHNPQMANKEMHDFLLLQGAEAPKEPMAGPSVPKSAGDPITLLKSAPRCAALP